MAEVHRRFGGRTGNLVYYWSTVYDVKAERGLPGAALDDILDHIDHAVRVAGVDHVGLGSDFDGVFDLPSGVGGRDAAAVDYVRPLEEGLQRSGRPQDPGRERAARDGGGGARGSPSTSEHARACGSTVGRVRRA